MTKKPHSAFSFLEISVTILIIGIVIAGIIGSQKIIRKTQIQAAQSVTKSSIVNSIPGLKLWLETSLDESITSAVNASDLQNNDRISSWNDTNTQSTSRINLTQGTQANQPLYQASGIGGLPSIKFDGSNDYLASTTTPLAAGDDDYTMIFVWRATSFSGGPVIIAQGDASATAGLVAQFWVNTTGTPFGFSSRNASYDCYSASPSSVALNTSYISVMKMNNALTNNCFLYTNSNTVSNAASSNKTALNLSNYEFAVGARAGSHSLPFNGLISEVMVFDTDLEHSDIVAIIEYLSKKYRIELN